jgi:hypothetical protein
MVIHGFRKLHKFVFQRFLNLVCLSLMRIDLNSNGIFNLFFCYLVCDFAFKLADIVRVFTYFQL